MVDEGVRVRVSMKSPAISLGFAPVSSNLTGVASLKTPPVIESPKVRREC